MPTVAQMGIPGIGTGVLQPKMQKNWRILFRGLGGAGAPTGTAANDLSMGVINFDRPSLDFEDIQVDRYNSRAYYAGKQTWSTTTLTIEDDVTNRCSSSITRQLERQQRLIGVTGPWLNSEATASSYKFGMQLDMLDGNELIVEQWLMEGCFIQACNWGQLDYSTGQAVHISLTVRFDNARQVIFNDVVGSVIGGIIQE